MRSPIKDDRSPTDDENPNKWLGRIYNRYGSKRSNRGYWW